MLIWKRILYAAAVLVAATSAQACEEFKAVSAEDAKAYRGKIEEVNADPIDKMFAIKELLCSDSVTLRNYAVKIGLKSTDDELVRNEILLERVMQMTEIIVEMNSSGIEDKVAKEFVKSNSGYIKYKLGNKFPTEGCVNFLSYDSEECNRSNRIMLNGPALRISDNSIDGEFHLSESGELVGYVSDQGDFGKIPSIIKLFD